MVLTATGIGFLKALSLKVAAYTQPKCPATENNSAKNKLSSSSMHEMKNVHHKLYTAGMDHTIFPKLIDTLRPETSTSITIFQETSSFLIF